MGALAEGIGDPEHTGELVRWLREAADLSVEHVAAGAGVAPERLLALEAGHGVTELGYDDVCALVRATQPPRPTWWLDGFEHDLTVTRLAPPATPEGRRYWSGVSEVREELERIGSGGPA